MHFGNPVYIDVQHRYERAPNRPSLHILKVYSPAESFSFIFDVK